MPAEDIVDIGFAEECEEPWRLSSRFFPSKVGGKPAWLALDQPPGAKELECAHCSEPCVFLCQLYAPYEETERGFHRSLFVFVCPKPDCCRPNDSGNLRVFRSQLERSNDFYPPEPPEERPDWRADLTVEKWSKVCGLCGIHAASHCAKCKQTNYCSRAHQVWHWKHGHKESCGKEQAEHKDLGFLFPEYELVMEREECNCGSDAESEEKELQKYEEMVRDGKAGSLQTEKDIDDDLLKMANDMEDRTFAKFKKRIGNDPDQVIRYSRGGSPLYISSANQPQDISKCECGSERQFEFQIMPQLLVYLKLENILNSIDWGVLLIYTCKNSCVQKSQYVQEYVWKQDLVKSTTDDVNSTL